MSDQAVRQALERMAAWLADPAWMPEARALADWDRELRAAAAAAERGPGWQELVAQAEQLGQRLAVRRAPLEAKLGELRAELFAQGKGGRALKGYRAITR